MTRPCSVCTTPYAAVSDDPSPAHPGCAPSDPARWEAVTGGPRTYRGVMSALHPSRCVCGAAISVGDEQTLRDTDDGVRWVCASCATSPQSRPEAAESAAVQLTRPQTSPERENANESPETTAPRRAA